MNTINYRFSPLVRQRLYRYRSFKRLPGYPFKDDPVKTLFASWLKTCHRAFYLSGYAVKSERQRIYQVMSDLFTWGKDDSMYDFNGAVVPKPATGSRGIFMWEFCDLILPHLIDSPEFCNCFHIEGPYELKQVCIDSGEVVIDCGANMGLFSAVSSAKGANVYAFEPFEHIIQNFLSKTAIANPNITICKYALSDKEGAVSFVQNDNLYAHSRIIDIKDVKDKLLVSNKETETVTVQTITLDKFVQENKLPRVDFIKADIEGAERLLLKGAKNTLKNLAPKLAICTYHIPDDPQVLRQLILDANPNYVIEERFLKMYAYVP